MRIRLGILALFAALALPGVVHAQGLYLPGGGATHISMGGASTATPFDAIGALYWNPAAIGRLGRSEADIGGTFLFPNTHLESTAPGPFGLRSGRTTSDSGVSPLSNVGVVYQPDDSLFTVGLGLNTLGGGGVNYPGDIRNPILSGIGPLGNVQGPIGANLMLVQLVPTVAYKVTDRLIFGFGPTVDVAVAAFDPAYFGTPDDANGDGIGTFPSGSHTRPFWGGGFRAGMTYALTDRLAVGAAYTSEQWFETWKFYTNTELGLPRTLTLNVSLPPIYSLGFSFQATDRLTLVTDLRYLDYKNAELFGTPIRDGGMGWQSVFAVALGGRFQATEKLALSGGYVYNENPIKSTGTLFNIQAPVINQHTFAVGSSYNVTDASSVSLGYAYALKNSISGPVREATGVGVGYDSQVHMLTFTMQFKFGGCGCHKSVTPCDMTCPQGTYPAATTQAGPSTVSATPGA